MRQWSDPSKAAKVCSSWKQLVVIVGGCLLVVLLMLVVVVVVVVFCWTFLSDPSPIIVYSCH